MDPYWDPAHGFTDIIRIRKGLKKAASDLIEDVELATMGGVDHLDCVQTGPGRHFESPQLTEPGCSLCCHGNSSGKKVGCSSDFGAALDSGVAADRHQPALLASDKSAG